MKVRHTYDGFETFEEALNAFRRDDSFVRIRHIYDDSSDCEEEVVFCEKIADKVFRVKNREKAIVFAALLLDVRQLEFTSKLMGKNYDFYAVEDARFRDSFEVSKDFLNEEIYTILW